MTLADSRKALLAMHAEGRRDQFLDLGFRYLDEVRDDAEITLNVLKALVHAGLGGPARELLAHRHDLAAAGLDTGELARSLEPVPDGRVPWIETDGVFTANLEALLAHRRNLCDAAAELRTAHMEYELHRSGDGQFHLSQREPGRLRRWVGSFHDPTGAADLRIPLGPSGPATVVIGTGVSRLVDRVYAATRPDEGAASVPIFVIDDALASVAAWLRTQDRTNMLGDPRLCLFVGPTALQQFEQFLALNEDIAPAEALFSPPWAGDQGREAAQVTRRIKARRQQAMIELAGRHRRRADRRSITDWIGRLQPGAAILGFTTRSTTMLQYSMRDIGHAFEALGYRFTLAIEKENHRYHSSLTTSRTVYETDPALIILINHFRHEQPQAMGAGPILSWIQDPSDVVLSKRTGESISPLDFVCGYYSKQCVEEFHFPREQFEPIRFFPICSHIFHDGANDPDEEDLLACDIMYVGHQLEPPASLRQRFRSRYDARYHPLLDHLDAVVAKYFTNGQHLLLPESSCIVVEAAKSLGVDVPEAARTSIAHFYAYRLFDSMYREQTLEWVSDWALRTNRRFRLYGRGWQTHVTLRRWAVGPIEHGPRLREAYRGATLVLQPIPTGFKHQRTFEALASGALVLTRYSPNDYELLSVAEYNTRFGGLRNNPGTPASFPLLDRVVFHDREEFEQHAESFLRDAAAREELQREFRRTTLESFTYDSVVPQIIARIRSGTTRPDLTHGSRPRSIDASS